MTSPVSFNAFVRSCAEDTVNDGSGDFAAYAAGIRDEAADVDAGRVSPRYVCVDCGRSMRIKPREGRCSRCNQPWPRIVCRGYTTASGAPIRCLDPILQQGDPGGQEIKSRCRVCAEMQRQADAQRYTRNARMVERRAREPHEVRKMTDEDWSDLARGE
ncbi:MAG: hypothetical protein ACM33U_08655 [Solirubrobacterales bacterium]